MSKITDLINKFCPNGVSYKHLIELGDFYGGLTGKSKSDFVDGNSKFITYVNVYKNPSLDLNSSEMVKIAEDENQRKLEYLDVIFTGSSETKDECALSSVVTEVPEEDYYLNSFCFIWRLKDKAIFNPHFLKHLLRSTVMRERLIKTASGVTRYNVSKKMMAQVLIPVPPIEIQNYIADLLDSLEKPLLKLIEKIDCEVELREKERAFYKQKCLIFNSDVHVLPIGEVCDVVTDYTAAGSFADIANNVKYVDSPDFAMLVRTMDLKSNFRKGNPVYINEHAYKYLWRVQLNKESLVLPNIGNCGEVYYVIPEKLPYDHNCLGPNAILVRSSHCNNRYLFYIFQSENYLNQLKKIIAPIGQTKFNKTEFKKLLIPLPSKTRQEEIVRILDSLENKYNCLISKLKRESKIHKMNFEYYRSQVLTFKEAK